MSERVRKWTAAEAEAALAELGRAGCRWSSSRGAGAWRRTVGGAGVAACGRRSWRRGPGSSSWRPGSPSSLTGCPFVDTALQAPRWNGGRSAWPRACIARCVPCERPHADAAGGPGLPGARPCRLAGLLLPTRRSGARQPRRDQRRPKHVLRPSTDPGPAPCAEPHPGLHRVPVAGGTQPRERTFTPSDHLGPLRPPLAGPAARRPGRPPRAWSDGDPGGPAAARRPPDAASARFATPALPVLRRVQGQRRAEPLEDRDAPGLPLAAVQTTGTATPP
jgi:hypothetical protein